MQVLSANTMLSRRPPAAKALLCVVAWVALSQAALPPDVVSHTKQATVYIKVRHMFSLTGDETTTTGTGFFVNASGHLVTSYHVVGPVLSLGGVGFPAPVAGIEVVRNSGSKQHRSTAARLLAVDKDNDLAVLQVADTGTTPFLRLGTGVKLVETASIWAFGYPFGESFAVLQRGPEVTVSKGVLSSLRHDDRGKLTAIQVDAPVNPGNSGGPLIDESGNVVGVVRMVYASGVNFAVPCGYVSALLDSVRAGDADGDSVSLTVRATPEDAVVSVGWVPRTSDKAGAIRLRRGWHTVSIAAPGHQSHVLQRMLSGTVEIPVTLEPCKAMRVSTAAQALPWPPFAACKLDTGEILFRENFDGEAVADQWEQSAGGTDKRTWFVEDGTLNQFESDETLHAIYMGSREWRDYTVRARFRIADEHDDSRAGIIFRETNDGFYLFRIHRETDKAQLAYHSKGPFGWFVIAERPLKRDITDKWHTIAVRAVGNSMRCVLDSVCVFDVSGDYASGGRIGFYSVESKASFDSVVVFAAHRTGAGRQTELRQDVNSFWFSDQFNAKSTWWHQYAGSDRAIVPWPMSDAGCALMADTTRVRYAEFTRYRLSDFLLSLMLSIGEGGGKGVVEIFFRKAAESHLALRFGEDSDDVQLVLVKGTSRRVLQRDPLPSGFFNSSSRLNLVAAGSRVSVRLGELSVLDYQGRGSLGGYGSFGFAIARVPIVFHQMTVSSVSREPVRAKRTRGRER